MGLEIDRDHFDADAYASFGTRLEVCLQSLAELLERDGFGEGESTLGAELEVSLVDGEAAPLLLNRRVLAETMDPRLTVELDRFNLESNLRHGPLAGRPFAFLAAECLDALAEMERAAALHGGRVATIGILPTLDRATLDGPAMTETPRYRALSASLRRIRQQPFALDIHGLDDLQLDDLHDVTYEGAATSFQVHLRIAPTAFTGTYNALQLATPVVLAAAGNSPTFLGKRLWEETRIALFKQAVDTRGPTLRDRVPARVSFGSGWARGAFELFEESVRHHAPLLPVLDAERPEAVLAGGGMPALRELRLHQGTVWRWNRAIYDPSAGGHLRVELRALPSGPTVPDMLANAAFHLGLGLALAPEGDAWCAGASFEEVDASFYAAARDGLSAKLPWPSEPGAALEWLPAQGLIERLLPLAQRGLDGAGVLRADSAPLLETFERRSRSGRTGSAWQRKALAAAEDTGLSRRDALAWMLERYLEANQSGDPVDRWPEPRA